MQGRVLVLGSRNKTGGEEGQWDPWDPGYPSMLRAGGGFTGTFCLFIIYTSMSMHISSRKKGANREGKTLMRWDRGD